MFQIFHWMNIFTIERFIFANFVQNFDFYQSQFCFIPAKLSLLYHRDLLLNPCFAFFVWFSLFVLEYSCFKTPKILLTNIFIIKMLISANFVQKKDFQWSQFWKLYGEVPKFYLFMLSLLRV